MDGSFDPNPKIYFDAKFQKYLLSTITSTIPLEICTSAIQGAGSGVVTKKALLAGTEVFRINKPFVTASFDPQSSCDNCYHTSSSGINAAGDYDAEVRKLFDCIGCKSVRYCGKHCQKEAWLRHHKSECKGLKKSHESKISDIRAPTTKAIDTAFMRIFQRYVRKVITPDERKAIDNLKSNTADYKAKTRAKTCTVYDTFIADILVPMGNEAESGLDIDQKFEIYCKLLTNSMSILQPNNEKSLGCTMEPFAAMINHSCDPNVFFFMEGSQLRFRTIKPIAAGEELLLAYTDPSYDVASRRKELLDTYHFECTCSRCKVELAQLKLQAKPDPSCIEGELELQEMLLKSQRVIATLGLPPDGIEQHIRATVAKHSSSDTLRRHGWPEHIQPMPDMRFFFAGITQNVHTEYSLKTLLKLCFVTFPRLHGGCRGRYWVQSFFLLTFTLRLLIKRTTQQGGDSRIANWSLIYIVYLKTMIDDAEKCYGADTEFVRANNRLLRKETGSMPPAVLRSEALVRQFRDDQKDMLRWAEVSDAKGVDLGDAGLVIA